MRAQLWALLLGCAVTAGVHAQQRLTLSEAIALAKEQNPEIVIARKQVEAARGGVVEARAASLPAVVSTGLLRKRTQQEQTRLRDDDYSASIRVVQSVYSAGANKALKRIAQLTQEKRELELAALTNRVVMDLRSAYYELLLNRANIGVREQSLQVMRDELRSQEERFAAGTVGELNVRRAEVSLANEQPELFAARTRLQNSYLRIGELVGVTMKPNERMPRFQVAGDLQYNRQQPDLNTALAYAAENRPEIHSRQLDVEIEEQQLIVDRSELRPRLEAFGGYELYSERDPEVGEEFNHGWVVGVNAVWHIFDGFATRGRVQATRARRDAAAEALQAMQNTVESEVRSAFFDLQQADRVLESETRNVQNASESLEIARANFGAGLGTQLEVLQATADVTRARTTRLNAIYLHNVALARLARATGREAEELRSAHVPNEQDAKRHAQAFDVARPPASLSR
ncbi:MAG TPA: TolC family protein [Chthoniobacterales bacterium]|nr:TolC family protein [Chthoniobacterales bacterium]